MEQARLKALVDQVQAVAMLSLVVNSVMEITRRILLEGRAIVQQIHSRQGPRNVDLRTPPGPEGSNGSLLDICRGHPGIFIYAFVLQSALES
jgi:hypothetical protein